MSRKAEYLPVQTRNSTTFDNTFQTLGTGQASPAIIVKIINNSTIGIDISIDGGVTPHDFVPVGGFFLYDLRSNHGRVDDFGFPTGTQWHIRGASAGTGLVYLVVIAEVT